MEKKTSVHVPSRKIFFRMAAVFFGLSVFMIFEGACRLFGWGSEAVVFDAFSEFDAVRPLFVPTDDASKLKVADNRRAYFAEESFAAQKPNHERRVFVFGGSTVQGRPFSIPTSFPAFLEIGLQHAESRSIDWEVVNCGGISYASYRLLPVMQECLQYKPDLFIVCTGHNEFLEFITYSDVLASSDFLRSGHGLLSGMQSVQLLRNAFQASPPPKPSSPALPEEVDAILDHQGGLEAYNRRALDAVAVADKFRLHLEQMNQLCARANIPILFLAPPSNLCDCPPFKSEFDAATTERTQQQITRNLSAAGRLTVSDPDEAIKILQRTTSLDPRYAFSWYQLGTILYSRSRFDEAHAAFVNARDEDVCPLRMTSDLRDVMDEVMRRNGESLLDVHDLLSAKCRHRIVGDAVLVDHIHPSFSANQQIALFLIDQMAEEDHIRLKTNFEDPSRAEFSEHLQSLDDLYYLRGQRTLETLRNWTQGRGDGPPLESRE